MREREKRGVREGMRDGEEETLARDILARGLSSQRAAMTRAMAEEAASCRDCRRAGRSAAEMAMLPSQAGASLALALASALTAAPPLLPGNPTASPSPALCISRSSPSEALSKLSIVQAMDNTGQ